MTIIRPPIACPVQTFWVEPTDEVELTLRRFETNGNTCPDPVWTHHRATLKIGRAIAGKDVDQEQVYRRPDTGEEWTYDTLPPGAMFDAWWLPDVWKGADGIGLVVICPDGRDHHNDMRASNCTRHDDDPDYTRHKCWVRHGDPRAVPSTLTVDKNGETCQAGAGSILTLDWHGFIRNGQLVT